MKNQIRRPVLVLSSYDNVCMIKIKLILISEDFIICFLEIEGREGKFKPSLTVIDRYVSRPKCLNNLSLIQFATNYYPYKKIDDSELSNYEVKEDDIASSEYHEKLPKYIKLDGPLDGKYMKLRGFPAVPRIHVSTKKEGYEKFYSEMLLFIQELLRQQQMLGNAIL